MLPNLLKNAEVGTGARHVCCKSNARDIKTQQDHIFNPLPYLASTKTLIMATKYPKTPEGVLCWIQIPARDLAKLQVSFSAILFQCYS